jgi:hypothetical protein
MLINDLVSGWIAVGVGFIAIAVFSVIYFREMNKLNKK